MVWSNIINEAPAAADGRNRKCILCRGTGYFVNANGGTQRCGCKTT